MKLVASISKKFLGHPTGWVPWVAFMLLYGMNAPQNLPQGIHAWAQADRLAVAYSFYENDLDFFQPATYSLNSEGGRVGVEFPAIQYVSAAFSKISGKETLPLIYRWINLLLLMGALLFLAGSISVRRIRWLVIWIITLSPVFMYYSQSFLPDTPSLASSIFGIGYFLRSFNYETNPIRCRNFSILFFGLAALFKATSGIYLLIFGGLYFFSELRQKKYALAFRYAGIVCVTAAVVAAFDYFYVIRTNEKFWSVIFMSKTNPVTRFEDISIIYKGIAQWFAEYFSLLSGIVTLLAIIIIVTDAFRNRSFEKMTIGLLSAIGVSSVLFFFGKQFINHDYYFVSSIYPLIVCMVIYFMQRASKGLPGMTKPNLVFAILIIISAVQVSRQAMARSQENYISGKKEFNNNVAWMTGGAVYLDDSLHIEKGARIFVLYEGAPNLPLLHFNRKGMTFNFEELSRERSPVYYWQKRLSPDYYIIQNQWIERLKNDLPEFAGTLKVVGKNDRFHVYETIDSNHK